MFQCSEGLELPIELVCCKNKFLGTSFRYQCTSTPPVELVEVGGSHLLLMQGELL